MNKLVIKRRIRASFTVEAAFIMPIVLFVILALIYFSFYLYDWCRLRTIADITLHKAILMVKHEADFDTGKVAYEDINDRGIFYLLTGSTKPEEDKARTYLQKELQKGFFCTDIADIQVTIDKRKVSVHLKGDFEVPFKGIMNYMGSHRWMEVRAEGSIHDPAEFLRIMDVLLETGERVKGLNQLMEWLHSKSPD